MNLYVSNLGDKITDESLRAVFATHGRVQSTRIVKDDVTGDSRGFAFVEMPDAVEAEAAILKINGMVVNGRNIAVKEANPRADQKASFMTKLRGW